MAEVVRELVAKLVFEVDASGAQRFEEATEGAAGAAEDMGESVDGAGVSTVAFGNIIADAAGRLVDFAANAAKKAVAALGDIVFGTSEAGDEIAKMSKQLGVDAEQLQRLRGAADLSGASIQDMNRGIRALTVGLSDAKSKGTGPVVEGFDALTISVGDVEGLLEEGKIEQAMGLIGDAFNETGESAEKNAALMKIFGARAGAQLRPLLESGTVGIRDMGDAIEATGEVIDNETLPTFEKMQDDLRLIEGAGKGVKNQIAAALAPVVSDIADRFNTWIAENQDFINQDLPEIMGMIAEALALVLPWVIDVITEFKNFYNEVGNLDERLEQDFGPTWVTIRDILWKVLDPLSTILEYLDRIIKRADQAIGRFRTVGSIAAEAAGSATDATTDTRGDVGFLNEANERARVSANEDRARIQEAEAREDAERQRAIDEQNQYIATRGREILRDANSDGRKLTSADIRALEEAGADPRFIADLQVRNEEVLARGKKGGGKGGGGGGKSKGGKSKGGKQPTIDELISGVGPSGAGSSSVEGGGAGPGLGGTFNTIDASYNATNTIQVTIDRGQAEGMPDGTLADMVAKRIDEQLAERDRTIFDHYAETVKGL